MQTDSECQYYQNFHSLSTVVSKASTLSFLVPFSPFSFWEFIVLSMMEAEKWKERENQDLVAIVFIQLTLDIMKLHFGIYFLCLYLSLFPNYILELLRTKTVFYTYYHFIFWTFWNTYISDNHLIPETRPWFLIQKICLLLESLQLAQRSSKLLRALSRFLLIIFSSLKLCRTIPLL